MPGLVVGLGAEGTNFKDVPGIVITHSPATSGLYIGSPSLAILTNGDYVASHDFFGPNSGEFQEARTILFSSADQGKTWKKLSEVHGAFWSSLFLNQGFLYLLGPNAHHGKIVIRRSIDGGRTWTTPTDSHSGLLREDAEYHCAPVPVLEHQGRIWRAFEQRNPPNGWGATYCAGVLSAPVDAELLDAGSWTASNFLPSNKSWNNGDMGGWLEGNVVATREGQLFDILRVETKAYPEKAALVHISPDGKTASFDPTNGFISFPGGAKKFTIRYDAKSDYYWSLATVVPAKLQTSARPAAIRNSLALTRSKDLNHWTVRCVLIHHPDSAKHGFQYADWLFHDNDLLALVRTSFDDSQGGAHNYHDANFLTFHRWNNFRQLAQRESVLESELPQREAAQ